VPIGICLSGGLDSTAIICAAERARRVTGQSADSISAFLYHHPDFDELQYVAATVEQTGAFVHRLEMGHYELWEMAERVLRAQDEPLHTLTAIVGYELMGLISGAGIRVALGGQGGDEVLAGYGSFFLDSWYTGLRHGHPVQTMRQIVDYTEKHGGHPVRLALRALRRLVQGQFQGSAWYRGLAHRHHRRQALRNGWFTGLALPSNEDVPPPIPLELNRVLGQAATVQPLPLYLRLEDRSSMAHSVEVRLPFLDYRLVELAFQLGPEWKIHGPWNKVLLREAMRDRIPEVVRARPDKMGFPSPNGSLLRGASFDRLFALVSSRRARERGVYAWDRMIGHLVAHRDQENLDLALRFFRVAQFELWAGLHGL
jgi:asparagine synthase (glutamine-hydrolysing)